MRTAERDARRWEWRPKLRWFAAEILIVVCGVLIALALNAWWQGREQAREERRLLVVSAETSSGRFEVITLKW